MQFPFNFAGSLVPGLPGAADFPAFNINQVLRFPEYVMGMI
jgi:hypothetical protein